MAENDSVVNGDGERGSDGDQRDLERLRELILEPEQCQLREILDRLNNEQRQAREVGTVLPAAIRHSNSTGPELERALAPTLEQVTHHAIRKDRKAFADALFPVMGPAIRKAIGEALKSLVQSLNQALEHSLSWKGLKWRLEALRTGRSFAEVVLSKTLVYRVEQIFLIHRESGLLLLHAIAPEVEAQDADMVSGMLTAIQDFVRDSFRMEGEEALQTMEVGDLHVWVEQGPEATLAAAIRGDAPVELRRKLRQTVETIHLDMEEELEDFGGDATVFEAVRPLVDDCLESQEVEEESSTSPLLWLALAALIVVVGWWVVAGWRADRALEMFLKALRSEPGIVVAEVSETPNGTMVRGLRDPLARDPLVVAGDVDLERFHILTAFEPYVSLDGGFVLQRSRSILAPPPTVALGLENGVLIASGAASPEWISGARRSARLVPGVADYDDTAVEAKDEGLLEAMRRIAEFESHIEARVVHFDVGSSEIDEAQLQRMSETVDDVRELVAAVETTFQMVRLTVAGHADPTGTPEVNIRLSRERAEAVRGFLIDSGIPERLVRIEGRGAQGSETEIDEGALEDLRKVTFIVEVTALDAQEDTIE